VAEHSGSRSGWTLLLIGAAWGVFILAVAVVGVGLVTASHDTGYDTTPIARNPAISHAGHGGEAVAGEPTASTTKAWKLKHINPQCYANAQTVTYVACQREVLDDTKFVQRYHGGQPAIARQHPEVATPDHANSLAYHGLDICEMAGDPNITLTGMVIRFMTEFHAHPGPVTESAALQTFAIALQSICPERMSAYAAKSRV
jgi:hypothetical protein